MRIRDHNLHFLTLWGIVLKGLCLIIPLPILLSGGGLLPKLCTRR
jgi:hypothetical protein